MGYNQDAALGEIGGAAVRGVDWSDEVKRDGARGKNVQRVSDQREAEEDKGEGNKKTAERT